MNPYLTHLQPYPFERLRQLFTGITPPTHLEPISLGIGEPKHITPDFIREAITECAAYEDVIATYPATLGDLKLRQMFAKWVLKRYDVALDPARHLLPVNGSREALFALAQAVIDPHPTPWVICPNPFYQIYEGAALLAGAKPYYAPCQSDGSFRVDWKAIPESIWANTQLVYVCSPGNPTGAVITLEEWDYLFTLSDRYGFVLASDECYSEIYFDQPPLGGLQAAKRLGRHDFKRLIMLTSLSKRSNVPGLRSGFVAGDAAILQSFLMYRTYHGCAMSPLVQAVSRVAWEDEDHVENNRLKYRAKFDTITPLLQTVLTVQRPEASFYLWAEVPLKIKQATNLSPDEWFAQQLYARYHVTVLPGSYLARSDAQGHHPGIGRIRMALVANGDECLTAAQRIVAFCQEMA